MQWDHKKALENERKHGIRFSDIEPVFLDPYALTIEDNSSKLEERFVTIGIDGFGRFLAIAYTYRGDDIRLISARLATPHEERAYEERI